MQPLWKTVWRFLRKLKIEVPFDLAIQLLGIYPEKTMTWKATCTPVFIAALYTIAKTWKQPTCPLKEEWIKKKWYIYTMEYYSTMRKNEIFQFAATWMDLEIIIPSKVSYIDKDILYIAYIWNLKNNTNELIYKTETDSQTQKTNLWLPKRMGRDKLGVWDSYIYTLYYIKEANNKDRELYNTGNFTQYLIIICSGKNLQKNMHESLHCTLKTNTTL